MGADQIPVGKNKEAPPPDNIVLELKENALDSLVHGVEHFLSEKRRTDLKYAVLHVFQAVELCLKARLAEVHPSLMLSRPEEHGSSDPKTVEFGALVKRVLAIDATISTDDQEVLEMVRRKRNQFEHHRVAMNRQYASDLIGKTVRFLETFLSEEMEIALKDEVDETTYHALSEAIHSWEERLERARREINELIPRTKEGMAYRLLDCPECGTGTVPDPNPGIKDEIECYLCRNTFELSTCDVCGDHHLDRDDICESCTDRIFDSRDEHGGY
jgi:hypothetical protein